MTGSKPKGFREGDNQDRSQTPRNKTSDYQRKYVESIIRSPEAVVNANEKQDNERQKIAEIVIMLENNNQEMNKEQKLQKEEIIQNGITHISKSPRVYDNFVESLSEWPKDWVIEGSAKNVEDKIRQITQADVFTTNDRVKVINTLLKDQLVGEITQELLVYSENDRRIATRIANIDFERVKDPKEKLQSFYHDKSNNLKEYTIEESESAKHAIEAIDAFEKISIANKMQIDKEVVDNKNWENDMRNAMMYYSELKERYNGESSDNKYPETVKSLIDEANLLDEKDKQQVRKESSSSHSTEIHASLRKLVDSADVTEEGRIKPLSASEKKVVDHYLAEMVRSILPEEYRDKEIVPEAEPVVFLDTRTHRLVGATTLTDFKNAYPNELLRHNNLKSLWNQAKDVYENRERAIFKANNETEVKDWHIGKLEVFHYKFDEKIYLIRHMTQSSREYSEKGSSTLFTHAKSGSSPNWNYIGYIEGNQFTSKTREG